MPIKTADQTKPKVGPMLHMVLAMGAILSPLAKPLLKRRLKRGKEDPARWREKLGEPTLPRPDGPLIWMHGVGVGEVMALRGLIETLSAQRPHLNFLVTSSARSSGDVFARNLPPRTQHQYLPLDLPTPVGMFLDHWRPDVAVWSDQEIWPRFAVTCARRGIAQALVAARITASSGRAKQRFGAAYGDLYRLLDVRHAQDDQTTEQLRNLMGDDTPVEITGSLKTAAAQLADDDPARQAVVAACARPIWVAASAHKADIDIALNAAKADGDGAHLLIIAPRELSTVEHIETACRNLGLSFVRRSTGELPNSTTNVYIADTFGELGLWYRASFAALIGGTFDAVEGHNPWEAVALGCPVLHGPRTRNFATDFSQLQGGNGARLVENSDDIIAALASGDLTAMANRAAAIRNRSAFGLDQITADLLGLMDR